MMRSTVAVWSIAMSRCNLRNRKKTRSSKNAEPLSTVFALIQKKKQTARVHSTSWLAMNENQDLMARMTSHDKPAAWSVLPE